MADFEENFEEAERRFDAQYELLEKCLLGEGTYGKVYKARVARTGEHVAMKEMKFNTRDEGIPRTAIREVALLKELSHPNVVRLLDDFCKPNKLVLVFELFESDLKKYMKSLNGKLTPPVVKNLAYQLCRGIEFCHANRIIHRDIKPHNLLIDQRMRLKIADFGLARAFSVPCPKYTHEVVTAWYRAPEILLGSSLYSVPVDLWSIGCVIAEMATGHPLFAADSEIEIIFKIFMKLGTPTEATWPGLSELPDFKPTFPRWAPRGWANTRNTLAQMGTDGIELLDRLMMYNPITRLSARRALHHTYFNDVDKTNITEA